MALPNPQDSPPANNDASVADLAVSAEPPEQEDDVVVTDDAAPPPSTENLAYAKSQGWVEKERYRGDPSEWVDAETFAERARSINPIINARNRELKGENEDLRRQMEEMRADTQGAIAFARAQAKREYDTELAALRNQKAAAIDDGDGATVVAIDDKIAKLKPPEEIKKTEPQLPAPVIRAAEEFAARNAWYGNPGDPGVDTNMVRLSMAVARTLLRERPDLRTSPEFFTELEYQLQADHPSVFGKKAVRTIVETGGGKVTNGSGKKRTLADMPKDAQETARRYVKNGWIKKEQEYVDQYFATEEQA